MMNQLTILKKQINKSFAAKHDPLNFVADIDQLLHFKRCVEKEIEELEHRLNLCIECIDKTSSMMGNEGAIEAHRRAQWHKTNLSYRLKRMRGRLSKALSRIKTLTPTGCHSAN